MTWWIWLIIVFAVLIILGVIFGGEAGDKNKICAWCNNTEIKFISGSGEQGRWFWKYRNKDGTKDKRVRDNFQLASFSSKYECDECSAVTFFGHYVDRDPDEGVKVWKRLLVVKGQDEREGTDWEGGDLTSIDITKANRKGG